MWWRFAVASIKAASRWDKCLKGKVPGVDMFIRHRLFVEYIGLYKSYLTTREDTDPRMQKIENRLPVKDVMFFREVAEQELEGELLNKQKLQAMRAKKAKTEA